MKYTLITGASGGIGYEIAVLFARDRHNLILTARSEARLNMIKEEFEKRYGINVIIIQSDLSGQNAAQDLYEETKERGLKVEQLVNNAGVGDWGAFMELDWDRQHELMQLNVISLMQLVKLYGSDMKEAGYGRILNVASVAAFCAGPNMATYYASKSFVMSFSLAVAEELRGSGVTMTVLCPGPTATGFEKASNMRASRMFTWIRPADAKSVAGCGYRAMQRGDRIALHSPFAKLVNITSRILPKVFHAKLARFINGEPSKSTGQP